MDGFDAPGGQFRQALPIDGHKTSLGTQTLALAAGAGQLAHELHVVAARTFRFGLPEETLDVVYRASGLPVTFAVIGAVF